MCSSRLKDKPNAHSVHRRNPYADWCGRRFGRHAGCVQPAEAGVEFGRAQVHRRDHVHRVPRHLRKRRCAVAPVPEGRRGRADRPGDGGHPQRAEVALRRAPRRQVRRGGPAGRGRTQRQVHQRPPSARQGDRRDRRGGCCPTHPAAVQAQEDDQPARSRRDRGQDRAHPAGQRVQRRPRQAADAGARP